MTYHRHVLEGCAPAPLAHYLKALGILRLVSEQKDKTCRGAWCNDRFVLVTVLSSNELERFFLEEYRPTAIFNPWGARSGFFPGGSEKTARTYLSKVLSSENVRFRDWHNQIAHVQAVVKAHGGAKPEGKDAQYSFIADILSVVRGSGQAWLSSSVPLGSQSSSSYKPPIFGTGGNEGSGSYTSAYLQALVEALEDRKWDMALAQTLLGTQGGLAKWGGTFGQFIPNSAGTAWDLLLALEGAVVFRSTIARRGNVSASRNLSSPFLVSPWATGSSSAAEGDEYQYQKGRANPGRGEQWFPLWTRLSSFSEIARLIEDGRVAFGRSQANTPLRFVQAVSAFGTARGVTEFLRYGYFQRNNLATHFAVPVGRVVVPTTTTPKPRLIDDLGNWLDQLHRLARGKGAPARLVYVERKMADAVFAALTHDDTPERWQAVLRAGVAVEKVQVVGAAIQADPIPKLSLEWVMACDDSSPEFRLALALGSAAGGFAENGKPYDPIRHHWLPLDEKKGSRRFAKSDKRLRHDVRVVCHGRDPEADLLAIVERRAIEAAAKSHRHPRLVSALGIEATLPDLAAWIAGTVDTMKCIELARAFMAVDWRWDASPIAFEPPTSKDQPDEAWACLRLNALPWAIKKGCEIPFDPAIVRRLSAGDVEDAVRLSLRRLNAHGIRPTVRFGLGDRALARRWGSALAFPISRRTALRLLNQIQPEPKETHHAR